MNTNLNAQYSIGEEIGNAVSHGIGAMLALIGYGYMLALCVHYGTALSVAACTVYCLTLFFMFICSTCYHALPYPTAKKVLRILDHCAIYLLIAGTYTPYLMLTLKGMDRWGFLGVIWMCAILGIVLNAINMKKYAKFSLALYIIMGWAAVFTIKPLIHAMPYAALMFLLIGGLLYTAGIFFYVRKGIPSMHFVWHLFVLFGAIVHFYGILLYVLPSNFAM